jgi:hypothetical protein
VKETMMGDEKQGRSPQSGTNKDGAPRKTRRPYKTPAITEYGSIARLTHTGGSTAKEGGSSKVRAGCL